MAPAQHGFDHSPANWQPSVATMYTLAPFLATLAFLAIRKYRNATLKQSIYDNEVRDQTECYLSENLPTFPRPNSEPEVKSVIAPDSDFFVQPSYKSDLRRVDPDSISAHQNATSELNTFSLPNFSIHQSGNVPNALLLPSVILAPVANGQRPFTTAEPSIQGVREIQDHPMTFVCYPTASHPQLQSETVQIFHGLGIEKGRAWKRKIMEYR